MQGRAGSACCSARPQGRRVRGRAHHRGATPVVGVAISEEGTERAVETDEAFEVGGPQADYI